MCGVQSYPPPRTTLQRPARHRFAVAVVALPVSAAALLGVPATALAAQQPAPFSGRPAAPTEQYRIDTGTASRAGEDEYVGAVALAGILIAAAGGTLLVRRRDGSDRGR